MFEYVFVLMLGFGVPFVYFYLTRNPQFGGKLTQEQLDLLKQSPNWKKGRFQNLVKTTMDVSLLSMPGLIRENIRGKKTREPAGEIPIVPFEANAFKKDGCPKFIWYGHAVLLLQVKDVNLLIDPMFGPDASPVGPIRTRRFSRDLDEHLRSLPAVDVILLTHDHYDHLDFSSIQFFKNGEQRFLVPLGVARHLVQWGISAERIDEFDWWDETLVSGLNFTFTPSRHFSGRGLKDRAKSLWGGWVIRSDEHAVYWSGDGGYGAHFDEIGKRLGPFDWGFMECGQYNERWHSIHMYPEEAVRAAKDAQVSAAVPFHWGAFSLALHHWKEPIERFVTSATEQNLEFLSPRLGQVVRMGQNESFPWWNDFD